MKKVVLGLTLLATVSGVQANRFLFVDKEFNDFVKRMIPTEQQHAFMKYHTNFLNKISEFEGDALVQKKQSLRENALLSLDGDHKAWADEVNLFLKDVKFLDQAYDTERGQVREFLERYGMYKEFSGVTANKNPNSVQLVQQTKARKMWNNFKVSFSKASHKVGNWFKTVKSQVMA